MIRTLSIRNYVLIEQLKIHFSDKLTIITGETGAGKSIILGALELIMGRRANTKVLYNQNEKCVVEGLFEIRHYNLVDFFEHHGLDYDLETIIRREISPSGKTRAFVNDTPVRLSVLKDLSTVLIDLHRQFDTQIISDTDFQIRAIDALAKNKQLRREYTAEFKKYTSSKRQLAQLIATSKKTKQEMEFCQLQYKELVHAQLRKGEIAELELEQKTLSNAGEIKRILGNAAYCVNDDDNCIHNQLNELLTQILGISELHSKLPRVVEQFESSIIELQELANAFRVIAEETEYNTERLEEIETRLNQLYRLYTKHSVSSEEQLFEIREDFAQRIKEYSDKNDEINKFKDEVVKQEDALWKLAKKISQRRKEVLRGFERNVQQLFMQLSMKHALLKVDLSPSGEFQLTGIDHLKFLFAPNKGSRFEDLKGVASGGELSRLALIVKSLVASAIPLPTIIFDEIDLGVSGEVALQMGVILQNLSQEHQIVSITHSPQIAAKASNHYLVHKKVQEGRTITTIRLLSEKERVLEIAQMLSGHSPTELAKQSARELLARSKKIFTES